LGGAVSIYLASKLGENAIKGLIIENTFTSVADMVHVVLPVFKHFTLLATNKWESKEAIKGIKVPILFISSTDDELVPPSQMKKLYEYATNTTKKMWYEIEAKHMDAWTKDGYYAPIKNFVYRECL